MEPFAQSFTTRVEPHGLRDGPIRAEEESVETSCGIGLLFCEPCHAQRTSAWARVGFLPREPRRIAEEENGLARTIEKGNALTGDRQHRVRIDAIDLPLYFARIFLEGRPSHP